MTPRLSIRSFTNDQYVLDKVFYTNFYRIRGFTEAEQRPVIVDIGAHCGYFVFAALSLGAKKVYAFEPFMPNYRMLLQNVGDNPITLVVPQQLGAYVAPVSLTFGYPVLIDKSYFDFARVGSDFNVDNPEFCKCCMLPLDTLLEHYVGEQVNILKLSIGYGEMAILNISERIKTQVDNICGEISLEETSIEKFKTLLSTKGFVDQELVAVEGEENKWLFNASKTSRKTVFK